MRLREARRLHQEALPGSAGRLNPQIAFLEAQGRYGGREVARFAARNQFAGEIIGLVGVAACARASALAYANASIAGSIGAQSLGPVSSGVLHGIRGGVFAGIMGGDFRSGFTGGFTEGALGRFIGKQGWDADPGSGTVMAGFISGTVSEVTGGKFAVGAFSRAMGYLFNAVASKRAQAQEGGESLDSISQVQHRQSGRMLRWENTTATSARKSVS